jgi:hypothetical protein
MLDKGVGLHVYRESSVLVSCERDSLGRESEADNEAQAGV